MADDVIIPVRSCYNGMAIYNGVKFFAPECTYTVYTSVPRDLFPAAFGHFRQQDPCEHVAFNLCLAFLPSGLRAGVVRYMLTI